MTHDVARRTLDELRIVMATTPETNPLIVIDQFVESLGRQADRNVTGTVTRCNIHTDYDIRCQSCVYHLWNNANPCKGDPTFQIQISLHEAFINGQEDVVLVLEGILDQLKQAPHFVWDKPRAIIDNGVACGSYGYFQPKKRERL